MAALGAVAAAAQLCVPCTVRSATSESACSTSCPLWSSRLQCGHALKPPLLPRSSGLSSLTWNGHLHLGPRQIQSLFKVWDRRSRSSAYRGVVQATLLGVGAPEALVIAVVALLVFGPRGLAEVARTVGKSLRAFQPTIRELQQVSREFKNTLEQEIGLDELRNPSLYSTPRPPVSTPPPPPPPPPAPTASSIPETLEAPVVPSPDTVPVASVPSPQILHEAPKKSSPQPAPQNPGPAEDPFAGGLKVLDEQLDAIKAKVRETVADEDKLASERAAWGGKTPGELQAEKKQATENQAEKKPPTENHLDEQLDAIKAKVRETVPDEDKLASERAAWGGKTPGELQAEKKQPTENQTEKKPPTENQN